jgi:hypothetical protein
VDKRNSSSKYIQERHLGKSRDIRAVGASLGADSPEDMKEILKDWKRR